MWATALTNVSGLSAKKDIKWIKIKSEWVSHASIFTQRNFLVDIAHTRNSDWMYENTGKSNWTC